MKKFDVGKYNQAQIDQALTCPVNRHAVRVKHGCDDLFLSSHPTLLVEHYIENGGTAEFSKRREEFVSECAV